MVSTDRGILQENSAVRQRMAEYGALVEELHIVIFSLQSKTQDSKFKIQISSKTWAYPTNSWSRWLYIFDAVGIGKKILSVLPTTYLITCQDPFETGRVGLALKRQFRIPLHVQIHTDFLSPYFARESFLNKLRVRMARKILANADGIRVVSERIKRSLLQTAEYKLQADPVVLPLLVDQDRLAPSAQPIPDALDLHKKYPQFAFIILMAARLAKEKNIPCALAALQEVVGKYGRTGLIITGEGPFKTELVTEAARLGLSGNVIFEGHTPQEVVFAYYKTANAFLLTSDYEGYALVLAEAALAGCPIVTSDVGIAADFFIDKESAFICPVGDHACLARGLLWLIEDVSKRESFAGKAREALSRCLYTKEEYARLYKEMWEGCAKTTIDI